MQSIKNIIEERYRVTGRDYVAIYAHMVKSGLGFCFLESGEFVTREDCERELTK